VGIGFKVTFAAATIGTIGYVAHSLQNKDELILSLQNQLKDQNRDNKKVSDELIQSLQNQLKDQNRDNKNMAAEIESLKKKPKGFF
jgi:septal ring factor EnvC (AmiA/AmiB activator)